MMIGILWQGREGGQVHRAGESAALLGSCVSGLPLIEA